MMSRSLCWLAVMAIVLGAYSAAMAKAPAKLQGKVFFTAEKIADQEEKAVIKIAEQSPTKIKLQRQKSGHWLVNAVAFFRKPAVAGPITIWTYDKSDKEALKNNEPMEALSVDGKGGDFFTTEIDFNPDKGYNKSRSYLIRIGQIIKKKEVIYASGEVTLEP